MKNYGIDSQKGKVIQIMILKGSEKWYNDYELEKYNHFFKHIWVGNNSGPRLSQLLKDGTVDVEYYENPKTFKTFFGKKEIHGYHRAKYRLKPELVDSYKILYNL